MQTIHYLPQRKTESWARGRDLFACELLHLASSLYHVDSIQFYSVRFHCLKISSDDLPGVATEVNTAKMLQQLPLDCLIKVFASGVAVRVRAAVRVRSASLWRLETLLQVPAACCHRPSVSFPGTTRTSLPALV